MSVSRKIKIKQYRFRISLTAFILFATLVRTVHVCHRFKPSLANRERRLNASSLLAPHRSRARGTRARRAFVCEPRVADEMIFTVARFAPILVYAHAVVKHLSGRARTHFRRQVFAWHLSGPQRLVVVAGLFATGRTSLVQ